MEISRFNWDIWILGNSYINLQFPILIRKTLFDFDKCKFVQKNLKKEIQIFNWRFLYLIGNSWIQLDVDKSNSNIEFSIHLELF